MQQVSRFQEKDSVLTLFRSQGLTAASVGPYLIGVADASVLSSPEKLADYIRENLNNRDNLIFFTKGRQPGLYNQVASHSEILSRAERMEEEHMRIRTPGEVPVPVEQPPTPVRTEREAPPATAAPRGRRRRREQPEEEETPAEAPAPEEQQAPPAETPSEEEPPVAAQPEEAPAPDAEPSVATPQAITVSEAQAETVSQIQISFNLRVDEHAFSNALRAVGLYDTARNEFSLGSQNVSRWNILTRSGLDLNGTSTLIFDVNAMVRDGIITAEEAAGMRSAPDLPLTLIGNLLGKIRENGADPDKYAYIANHEQIGIEAFMDAFNFVKDSMQAFAADPQAILKEFSRRVGVLQQMVSDYDALLDQLSGKPPDEEATVATPAGAERSGKVSELTRDFQEEKNRAVRELESLLRFGTKETLGRMLAANIGTSFF